jgi:uncharacterized phage protein (TIGR02218 family)
MKYAPGSLIALLNGNSVFLMADLYTITLRNAAVYRWTTADTDIVSAGNTFSCASDNGASVPLIERGPIRTARGLEVDTLSIKLNAGQTVAMGGIPLVLAAHNGIFDGATVKIERAFMNTWGDTTTGVICPFEGRVSDVSPSTTEIALNVKSNLEQLATQWPRNLFMPQCSNAFGDAGCGFDVAGNTDTSAMTGTPTATAFTASLPHGTGFYTLGYVTVTSGPSAGAQRAVKSWDGTTVVLALPLPQVPGVGNTFTITPGCDRQFTTCGTKFSNAGRFRGCPFVPVPETTR